MSFYCSITEVLYHIDSAIQFGEDADVKTRDFEEAEPEEPSEGMTMGEYMEGMRN